MKKLILLLSFFLISFIGVGQVNISAGNTVTENFTIGTSTTATLPSGWKADKSTTVRTVGTYSAAVTATEQRAGNSMGSSATNGIYNYAAGDPATATERAIGGLSATSASKSVNVYVQLYNNGATTINDFTISYNIEKYRNGSNAAGYSIQMYYSTDGSSWTSAGSNFLTSFSSDADNNGYASAPGSTVSISSKTLSQSLTSSSSLYLAWNYSVTSGTTTSNAQALGIDDVSITANFTSSPTLTVFPSTLSGFVYDYGNGPSVSQSYSLSGTNLTGFPSNIVLTAPANYEISTDDITFSNTINVPYSSATLSSTTIYVRLKAGLSAGTYNGEIITNAGGGATTVNVTCNGQVKDLCTLEEFNGGTTAPAGWTFTSIGGIYTTSTNYGNSSPSLKMDATGDRVETLSVTGINSMSFWLKGQGTDATSSLKVEGWNGAWVVMETIVPLPTTGTTKTYNTSAYTKFRFTYTKNAGNLAFDDVNICSASTNTITTGTVLTTPFSVTCTDGTAGTVAFTSTGTYLSNTYTVQLSNSTGSFTSPLNIGTLVSDANSGTINIDIPAGISSGAGYKIRVVSSSPTINGTSSSSFSINLTGGPCGSYFEIQSILVDACEDSTGWEGENEMFRFIVGSTSLNTSDITVSWPNNPWKGLCQNATTATIVSAINATITGGGQLIEPTGGVLPAGAQVMFFTNTQFSYELFDFSTLNYTLYAIFQCEDNHPGHFVNYSSTSKLRTLTLNFDGFGSDMVTYDAHLIYNGNGATVDFDPPGNPTYSPNGSCNTVPIFPLPISLLYFDYQCYSDHIILQWSTATETNNNYFDINYSTDGWDYTSISRINGAGNSNFQIYYEQRVGNKTGYYRLKQTDYDGKYSYFGPIYVNCEGDYNFTILPNPFKEEIMVQILDDIRVDITLYDILGNILNPEMFYNGNNLKIDMKKYKDGIYFLNINGKMYKIIKLN